MLNNIIFKNGTDSNDSGVPKAIQVVGGRGFGKHFERRGPLENVS
jgi:hypothetical protein